MSRTLLCILFSLVLFTADAADVPADLPAAYKDIDVRLLIDTVKALREAKGDALGAVVGSITNRPENFAPPVLYVVSSVLFEQGKKDEAVFWFYAGQLRGRIDANICADRSAASAIVAMNQKFGPAISQYSSTNLSLLTNTLELVLAWEENTPCLYDRRWINLHGMNAMTGENNFPLSAPPEQWEAIRKRTRDLFAADFQRAVAVAKERKD